MELKILGKTITGAPDTAVPEALAAVAAGVDDAFGKHAANEEKVEKLNRVINEELLPKLQAQKEELAALAREVPGPAPKDAQFSLKREALSLVPQHDAKDKDFAGLANMSRGQFSILTQPISALTDDDTTAKALKRYRMLRDAAVVAHAYFSGHRNQFPDYQGWGSLPINKELVELERRFQGTNALADGNAANGAEWIKANVLSGSLIDRMDPYLELSKAFTSFPMEAATVKRAGRGSRVTTYLVAETTADSGTSYNSPTKSRFGTAERTFTAHKQMAFVIDSEEWDQDSIFNAAQEILSEIAYGFAYDEEEVIVNGSHTTTVNQSAAAAGSIVLLADGIRAAFKNAVDNSLVSGALDASSGLTAEMLALAWAQQGVFGKQPDGLWAVSSSGLARMMLAKSSDGVAIWLRADTLGGSATAVTGTLGAVFGRPVLMSSVIPETMDAAGSVPDVASNLTGIYHINRRAFQKGERKGITLAASSEYLFGYDQFAYRGVRRWDFEAMYAPATYPLVNAVLSVPTA